MSYEVSYARELKYGIEHPDTLTSMHGHAVVLKKLRKYQEALLLEGRVIKMREKLLGPDHRDTLNIKHNYALTL